MKRGEVEILMGLALLMPAAAGLRAAEETVATAVYARVGHGYERARLADGSFAPEYYALANGGRIEGTGSDVTVDRVTYPEVAEIAMRLLARQGYHYAQTRDQAKLMIVLHWGATHTFDRVNYDLAIANAVTAKAELGAISGAVAATEGGAEARKAASTDAVNKLESALLLIAMQNRVRDQINLPNARLLGYLDDLNESNDIRRWAGGGDRYNDLIGDVEEARYYIMVSAYDFEVLTGQQKRKLLWQTRVSVRSPGNSFDDSVVAMLKSGSKYFGQDSGRLIRGEEAKGKVEFGDLKFLGEAGKPNEPTTGEKK